MRGTTIEVVRGRPRPGRADDIVAFWARHGALRGAAAEERLSEVVCILVDADGGIVGVNSAHDATVPLVGGRRFWRYRRFLDPVVRDAGHDVPMINEAYDALAADHVAGAGGPVGLCVTVDDPALVRARPEAVWADTGLFHVGWEHQGQVRIRYFDGAVIA